MFTLSRQTKKRPPPCPRAVFSLLILFALVLTASPVPAGFIFDATVPIDKRTEEAIVRAQTWLASRQKKNGSWGNNGENGMAIAALMVNGTTPGKGRFGAHVAKGVEFIVSTQKPSGLYVSAAGKNSMYEHALATLAIAEAYGVTHNPSIRESLIKAINLIVESQHYTGGWRYNPKPERGDLSVTVMQVMALRAGAEVGIYVPDETITHAIKFIKSCWHEQSAGFGYAGSGKTNFNRAGAGVVCLQSVGLFDDRMIPKAARTILNEGLKAIKGKANHRDVKYWYGHYYASVALYHYGGAHWKSYYPKVCEMVRNDWKSTGYYRQVLSTAWAILTIGVPYRYLPIYQR